MKRALVLAKKGIGFTSPNPCVGAVIVKCGKIISEGWHKKAGKDHAEISAIKNLMKKSGIVTMDLDPMLFKNAELYVTLEPCTFTGKTPPCSSIISTANFKKVNIGMIDPFKIVNRKGVKTLKKAGIEVEICKRGTELSKKIRNINQPFIKWASTGIPYVILKAGMSLDGKISTSTGESKWITSEEARKDARRQRSLCDAVLVGAGTVIADDPELLSHGKYSKKKILRVILDRKLKSPVNSKVFKNGNVFVACTDLASKTKKQKFTKAGIKFKSFGKKDISIKKLLGFLGKRKIQSVFVEGGSTVNGLFFDSTLRDEKMIDKVIYYIAPKLIGGKDSLPVIGGEGIKKLSKALEIDNFEFGKVGNNIKFEGILNFY